MTPQIEQLYNDRQAAALLGVKEQTLRAWRMQGRLPHVRLGRAVRYRESDLARIVQHGLEAAHDN